MQTPRHYTDTPGLAGGRSHGRKLPTPRAVMWAAIALALALFGLFLAVGWRDNAATTAAATLLLACVAVCIWAGVQGWSADREVDRAIARLTAARKQDERRRSPKQATDGR